jgi:hypothetical protein
MAYTRFDWDPGKDAENQRKHGISFSRAQYAFADPQRVIAKDSTHSQTESGSTASVKSMVICSQCGSLTAPQSFESLAPVIGARERPSMSAKIKYTDEPLGEIQVIPDFLPSPAEIYGRLAQDWLEGIRTLLIVVDGSPVTADQKWQLLRASVAVEGRSVTLYEEVHSQHRLGSRWVQQRFLGSLARLIPAGCKPIILTDAGFRSPWFDAVKRRHSISISEVN